jgi:hypothetical protein
MDWLHIASAVIAVASALANVIPQQTIFSRIVNAIALNWHPATRPPE